MSSGLPELVANAVMRLRSRAPFFSVLALHSEWIADPNIGTAATDGRRILFAPAFIQDLTSDQRDGLVAHEACHVALRHVARCGEYDPVRWNVAADIVVNGMVTAMGLKLPPGAIRDQELEHLSVEEVYWRLSNPPENHRRKLGARIGHKGRDLMSHHSGDTQQTVTERTHWEDVVRKAIVLQRMHDQRSGTKSMNALREIEGLLEPQLDWRTLLWRFLVQRPYDFQGWDRRHVYKGMYVDDFAGETLTVAACLDTSGSVNQSMLRSFLGELQGIRHAHPAIRMAVYFADTKLYGPFWLSRDGELPIPLGGGGTRFEPFIDAIDPTRNHQTELDFDVAVYLTDGYAELPKNIPTIPFMWLVPTGQRTDFEWGEVVFMEPS